MSKKKILIIVLGIIIILIDQLIKALLIGKDITLIPNVLNITYTETTGSIFEFIGGNLFTIIVINVVILGVIIKFLKENEEQINYPIIISLVLILAGGISNLIDRIFRGYVIDFIDINLYNFPHFNIADICVCVGVIGVLIFILTSFIKDNKK